jgi:3-oxoadipate enol-lactonase
MMSVALHYTVDGPAGAPVLVLGSSLGTTGEMWQPQIATLGEHFRVVRYDHRGHGGSPVPPGPYQMADLGGDVLALLDHLGVARAHLAGSSMGGMAAMWVAAHAPDRVDRLALLCTSALLGPPSMWVERASAVRDGGMAAIAEATVARWFTPGFARQHAGVVGWARRLLTSTPPEGYASCCAAIETMDLTGDLPAITAPTLVIAGADDPATPPVPHGSTIVDGIKDAQLEVVPDSAHMASIEKPDVVGQLLVKFLGGAA